MTIEDKVIMGSDLCNSECIERNNIIHPETCLGQVKLTDSNGLSLYDWINNNANNPAEYYSSLKDWLNDNYSSSGSDIPIATTTRIGGVKINDEYLTINREGLLGVDVEALPSYEEHNASFDILGSVKLGNDTIINEDFGNGTITIDDFYKFPLRSDINNRTGIAIPKSLFNGTQADWNENDIFSLSYILNKPQIANPNWDEENPNSLAYIQNKPVIPAFTGGEGISISSDVVSQIAATNNTLGGIKLGYTKNDNKKPVQLNANNEAYVDTEQHLTIGGMITNGLSAHFYRVGTGSSAGSFTQNTWIPIIMSTSNNIGKCSVEFEILGREDGKTSYGKYYVNHMTNTTNKLLCLSFYSEDTDHFDYNDIRAAKYAIDNNNVTIVVYKKVRDVSDSMFIVNILAENTAHYSTQHYFYTGSSSISDANYLLTRTDLRIGTMNADTQSITAKLINDESASSITMNTIGATNATYYTTT